ncbi:uncharacterized protein PRCAT00001514001 [Priceomyces carsonii]|uniref:uncharacterized protein n=1 Tax=Priceomyces carsonii TaxID=28549 RepID=UPI002EDACE2E|nr:unnamed protein product [Priceomyces carsonii]
MSQLQAGESLLTALISGSTAAAVTSTFTYPFDCIKTQQQLNNPLKMTRYNIPGNFPSSLSQIMKGSSALVTGNVLKSCARLILYNWLSKFMSIETHVKDGKLVQKTTAPRIVIAGAMSGLIESLWIIPFENIKIAMIQNMTLHNELIRTKEKDAIYDITGTSVANKHHKTSQNIFKKQYVSPHAYWTSEVVAQYYGRQPSRFHSSKQPKKDSLKSKYNKSPSLSLVGTCREIYSLKGPQGFFAGSFVTIFRQMAISSVWLSSYNATSQLIDPVGGSKEVNWFGGKHTAIQLIGLHLVSSFAVIAATQPIDVVKTHIQLKNGKVIYKDSLSTAYKLFMNQGFKSLFRGAFPRYLKVAVSGGLTASVYSYVENIVNVTGGETLITE